MNLNKISKIVEGLELTLQENRKRYCLFTQADQSVVRITVRDEDVLLSQGEDNYGKSNPHFPVRAHVNAGLHGWSNLVYYDTVSAEGEPLSVLREEKLLPAGDNPHIASVIKTFNDCMKSYTSPLTAYDESPLAVYDKLFELAERNIIDGDGMEQMSDALRKIGVYWLDADIRGIPFLQPDSLRIREKNGVKTIVFYDISIKDIKE